MLNEKTQKQEARVDERWNSKPTEYVITKSKCNCQASAMQDRNGAAFSEKKRKMHPPHDASHIVDSLPNQ